MFDFENKTIVSFIFFAQLFKQLLFYSYKETKRRNKNMQKYYSMELNTFLLNSEATL